jgi:hypothetical protein
MTQTSDQPPGSGKRSEVLRSLEPNANVFGEYRFKAGRGKRGKRGEGKDSFNGDFRKKSRKAHSFPVN